MVIVLMGVSGSGKTTVGLKLAGALKTAFLDGDDLHPSANIVKMSRGEPLTDEDRGPWLDAIAAKIAEAVAQHHDLVVACSALRTMYRRRLQVDPAVRFVYLKGSPQLVASRLDSRAGHFMPASLLQSQFDSLEEPSNVLTLDIGDPPDALVEKIIREFRNRPD